MTTGWPATFESVAGMAGIISWGYLVHINGFHPTTSALGILMIGGLGGYRIAKDYFNSK